MTPSRLPLTLPVLAALLLAGIFSAGPASAGPLAWAKDAKGNAYLGGADAGAKDASPVCPASMLGFELKWTGTYNSFDGTDLTGGQTVYGCTYKSNDPDMLLWVQIYQPAGGLPDKAADALSGPVGRYAGKGFTQTDAEATDACAKSIELITRPGRYKESVFETPDKVKPSSKVACAITRTDGRDAFSQVTAQREGRWIIRTITDGEPGHIELATGVSTLLYAVQKPQPDWIRNMMGLDNVL